MKFTTALFSAACLLSLVAAQATTTSAPVPTISPVPETKEQKCLKTCSASDTKCQATCLGVPTPNAEDIAKTQKCAGECKQGDGSAEQTKAYGDCLLKCYSDFFLPGTNTFTSNPTGTGSANLPDQTNPGNNGGNGNGNGDGQNGNNTGGNGNETDNGNDNNNSGAGSISIVYGASFAGLVGAIGAALAL